MKFKNYIETESGIKDTSTSPGTAGQVLSSTVTGTSWINPDTLEAAASKLVVISCKNVSGVSMLKGTPVYQSGTVGATDVIEVEPADATISTGYLPAIGILQTTLNNNDFGNVVITGEFLNYSTSDIPTDRPGGDPFTGDTVYLAAGGGLTCIKPTGAGNAIQNMGLIGKVSGGNAGSITVSSIMRANDVPNLPEGRIWIGDGNTIVSDTVYVDELNNRFGIGTTSPNTTLEVDGAISTTTSDYAQGTTGSRLLLETSGSGNTYSYIQAQNSGGASSAEDLALQLYGGNASIGGAAENNRKLKVHGNASIDGGLYITGASTAYSIEVGQSRSVDGVAFLDLTGEVAPDDYGLRMIRYGGLNAESQIIHTGTANLTINASNGADTVFANTNVGINESNPSAKLEVDGTINFNSGGDHGFLLDAEFGTFSLGDKDGVGYENWIESLNGNIDIYNSGGLTFRADVNNRVGIGTPNPGAKLEISDTTLAETRITSYPSSGYSGQSNLWLQTGQYGNSMIALGYSSSGTAATASAGIRYDDFASTMTIKTNSSDRLTINSSGTVRILGSGSAAILEIGTYGGKITSNYSTLETNSNFKINGSVIVGDPNAMPSSAYAGALRYRVSGNNSYVDMCMQTGASTYTWVNVVQNQW